MIAVVGSANMDAVAEVAALPQPGETVLARGMTRLPGGKGANQAVAAARAGSEVYFVGRVGTDAYGHEITDNLRRAGVRSDYLTVDETNPTGMALVTVDEQGENSVVVIPGANGLVGVGDLERARTVLTRSSVIVVQLEIPIETVQRAAEMAHEAGATLVLNAAPARTLEPQLLRLVDVLILNEGELAQLSGLGAPIHAASSAHLMLDTGISTLVITRGRLGALIVSRDGTVEVPAFESRAVDTTGAGDTFVGNFAHALDIGLELEDAVRFANAAAALSVRQAGAQTAMPTEAETLALIQGGRQTW